MNIAIIPARGGSKGIPKKNIIELCGKPLIAYTIQAAQEAMLIDKVYVTTDDNDIANVSMKYCKNIIMRPDELAKDESPTLPTITHALINIPNNKDISKIVILQATSPLRVSSQIDEAILAYTEEYSSVVSVCEAEHTPFKMYTIKDGRLDDFVDKKWRGKPRQETPNVYRETGAIYVTTTNTLNSGSIIGDNPKPYIMPHEYSIDIDNLHDLKMAQLFLTERVENEEFK